MAVVAEEEEDSVRLSWPASVVDAAWRSAARTACAVVVRSPPVSFSNKLFFTPTIHPL